MYQWLNHGGVERSHDVTVDQIVHLLRTSFSAISNFLSFFRLSLDFLQAFFRLSLDFLQTFFRLSSDFLQTFSPHSLVSSVQADPAGSARFSVS